MPEIRPVLDKKKLLRVTGITLAVYAGMKYLLPLVIPFFGCSNSGKNGTPAS